MASYAGFIKKSFCGSTNRENLVNIGQVVSEIICLIRRPLKRNTKIKSEEKTWEKCVARRIADAWVG